MAGFAKPYLREWASVMTLSYQASWQAQPFYGMMGVAKATLESCVRYLATELGPQRVRVNAISPGPIETPAALGEVLAFLRDPSALDTEAGKVFKVLIEQMRADPELAGADEVTRARAHLEQGAGALRQGERDAGDRHAGRRRRQRAIPRERSVAQDQRSGAAHRRRDVVVADDADALIDRPPLAIRSGATGADSTKTQGKSEECTGVQLAVQMLALLAGTMSVAAGAEPPLDYFTRHDDVDALADLARRQVARRRAESARYEPRRLHQPCQT